MAPEKSPSDGRRTRLIIAAVVASVLLLVAAFAAGSLSAPVATAPSSTSAEAGFARDMQTHHGQAVEMSFIIRDLTDDADVRLLAYDIANSQSQQAGQMNGWLTVWNLPQTAPEPSMTWMSRPALTGVSHEGMSEMGTGESSHTPGDAMPGMATAEQLAALKASTGTEAVRQYLTLMIAHHRGGVEMADAVLERSNERVVRSLAASIVKAQSSEIGYMQELLDALPAA
ncbi:hypothetical protein GCM10027413_06580 [Conyzicola nivalis]|uniref:DUF305 domain-containing protein n=1 Tax=Conyzicola nivalis TaxID=1477021 RepID=A0A916SL43_9MICO|nr:DUF305 domain-containing protein [Conyzicola nivalis]GGB05382.1 hypothetical protein GCM10010979_20050 [Conyzicola nivalis]